MAKRIDVSLVHKRSQCLWASVFLMLVLAAKVAATTVIPPSFDKLVQDAEIIFEGQVTAMASKWVGQNETRKIKTDYTFKVSETLKGTVPSVYVLQVLGGTVGDTTMKVEGAPNFSKGDRVILFVKRNGIQFVPLVGIMHGHYKLAHETAINQDIVIKHDGETLNDVDGIGRDAMAAGGRLGKMRAQGATPPMTPEIFKDKIRAKAREGIR